MTTSSASSAQLGIQKLFGEEPAAPKEQVRSAAAGLLEAVLAPAPTRDSKALVALQREPADDVRSAPRFDELVRRAASDPPLRFALRACFARSTTPLRIVDDALLELALAPDADAAVVEEALALLAAPTRTATECVDVLARLCARGQRQHLARIFDTQLPSLHASIVLGALRGDARDEERSDAAALLTLHASTSSFVAQVDDVASRALLPRAGVSHLALDAARGHAAAVAEHELGRRALAASGTRALASALSNVFKAPVDGHLRKTFEARTLPAAGGAPVDRLGAQLRHVVGLPSILLNAGAQKGVRADDVQPDAELTRARPEVWLPYLLNAHLEKHDAFDDDTVQAALKHAVDDVDEWRARAIQSKDGRGSAVAQREGTAAAVAFAVVLLDLEREANSDDGSEGDRPLARLPTLLDMLASTRVSKSRNLRPQTLAALYRLAALGDTLPAGSPMWRDIDATLAAPNHGAFLQQAEDVAAEIARRHPSGVSFADALTRGLGGGTRAANVGKWAQGIANYFHVGAERAALDHLIACVTKGTLAAERRATLHAGRFAGANIEPARREALFDNLSAGARTTVAALGARAGLDADEQRKSWELVDTDTVLDWTRANDDIQCCQSTNAPPRYNRGLLNRFEDGAVRLLALRDDDGRTRASAEMRLATLENGALALVVDKLYADGPSRAAGKPLLAAFARERAAALGVELVLTDDYVDDDVLEPLLVQLPDAVAPDYIDLAGKGHTSTGPVRALLIAAHREGPGDIEGQARALGIDVKVARHAP